MLVEALLVLRVAAIMHVSYVSGLPLGGTTIGTVVVFGHFGAQGYEVW